jgi:hypothetical protein
MLSMDATISRKRHTLLKATLLSSLLVAGATAATCLCHGKIIVKKFYDANANGIQDAGEVRLAGWPMTVESASRTFSSSKPTDTFGYATFHSLATASDYTAREAMPLQSNWVQSSPRDGAGNPVNPQTGIHVTAGGTTQLAFGNYCTKPSGGRTPGYWSNKNGLDKLMDGGSLAPEFTLLSALHLRTAGGADFDPVTYPQFRTWLLGSTATNMAYKLSSHLAAMRLNVEAGYVNGTRVYAPFGGTINQLMTLADNSLASDPLTPTGHPERAYQEQLKNYLDALNNGAAVVSPTPCTRTFN